MRVTGKIVRFDDVRGYGFITPDTGGDDVFLHANDLEMDKPLARPGAKVSFEIEQGNRGKFATCVRLSANAPITNLSGPSGAALHDTSTADDYFDVLSVEEYLHAVTETLLRISPPLTGQQILEVRNSLEQIARKRGWIEP